MVWDNRGGELLDAFSLAVGPNVINETKPSPTRGVILLVEDDSQDVEIMRLAFARSGAPFQLTVVANGRQAVHYLCGIGDYADRIRFPKPLLILLDLSLPVMGGFEFLAWMQGEALEEMPPVVVLSYSRLEQDRKLAQKFGAKGYFVKSPNLEETVALVKSLLLLHWLPPLSGGTDQRPPNAL